MPQPWVQQAPTPVAPSSGADPVMNTMVGMARSMTSMDSRNLLRLAVILLVAIVAIVVLIKVVGWFLSILPWLIVLAAVVAIWRVNKWRRRRLP